MLALGTIIAGIGAGYLFMTAIGVLSIAAATNPQVNESLASMMNIIPVMTTLILAFSFASVVVKNQNRGPKYVLVQAIIHLVFSIIFNGLVTFARYAM